jgi:acyl dehydratase
VAINPGYAGRTFQPSGPYEVSRVKIAEFADAIGETSPLCRDRAAAQAAGYPDVIAPPTFAIVISMAAVADLAHEPDLGLNYAMVVHGLQSFTHARPLHAGDVVLSQSTIESVKPLGRMTTMTTVTEIRTVDGEQVCTARSALVERGPVEPGTLEPGTVEPGA